MSLTLGEKLRQAREDRGLSISEVAEQTRISALYLESIENNDYRVLPGGIFNKGFVKSYAKQVGLDEQEALQDYSRLLAEQTESGEEQPIYRPEVLTDDRSRSLFPTIVLAIVILGLMVWGILALLNYYNNRQKQPVANTNTNLSNTNIQSNAVVNAAPTPAIPFSGEIKVDFKALTGPISLTSVTDGRKAYTIIMPDKPATFEPKQSLTLSYSKNQSSNAQLVLNGKPINLPSQPENPKRSIIELTFTKETAQQVYKDGAITFGAPDANANSAARR